MRKFLKNQKGVTMIEVLVTIAILAIVVTPCLSAFVMAQRGNVKAAETKQAYTAAANLMEELKGWGDEEPEKRLGQDYTVENIRVNDSDGIHVLYLDKGDYLEIWIYAGDYLGDQIVKNRPLETDESAPDGYLIKGVIARD